MIGQKQKIDLRGSCPHLVFLALLLLLLTATAVLQSPGAGWAKSTRDLIAEQAALQDVTLSEQETAVLRRALPIVGGRYLRELDPTPLLKRTMLGLKEYDAALAAAKRNATENAAGKIKSGKGAKHATDKDGAAVKPISKFRRIALALNKGLNKLDAHSAYLDPDSYGELKIRISGKFAGLGLEVTLEEGLVKVIAP
nr:hypothetical protein [Alphaproteobacteria bacterium]